MARIVIPRIMVRAITPEDQRSLLRYTQIQEDAVLHTACMLSTGGAMLLHVCREYKDTPRISLSAKGRDGRCYPDDLIRDPQDHGCGSLHQMANIMVSSSATGLDHGVQPLEEGEGVCAVTLHAWYSTGGVMQCGVVEYTVLGQEKKKDDLHP